MLIQVITRHTPINYGSLLQSIATQKIFEDCGCECKIIDYFRADEEYKKIEYTILKNKKSWNGNPIKRTIYLLLRVPPSIYAGKRFRKMQKQFLNLTPRYSSNEELRLHIEPADYYVTGSDQVWGKIACGEYDSSYFLDFVKDDAKKLAFASSMGHSTRTEEEEKLFIEYLSKYKSIAVREDSVVEYFKNIGIDAQQVLDPTLMIEGDEWRKYKTPIKKKRYILIYQIHSDERLGRYAEEYAKKKGLELIRISQNFHQILREGKFVYLPSVGEFLEYIDNAECLITDSFHGTAFAINLNTDFIEILPNTNTSSRNQSVLRLLGLSDRIVMDMNDFSIGDKKIDYDVVNERLHEEREKSFEVLRKIIE